MDRFVVMVDAGYFLRQALEIASQKQSKKRSDLQITNPAGLLQLLVSQSRTALDCDKRELLRVYWYDGVGTTGPTPQQRSIINLPDLSFRSGTINGAGQQKGVDSLIVTDLIELASNRAICDAALVTGDSDLAVGIEIAQKKGVRIAVIGVEDLSVGVSHSQSFEITSRADRIIRIGANELSSLIHVSAPAPNPQPPSSNSQSASTGAPTPPAPTPHQANTTTASATSKAAAVAATPNQSAIVKAVQAFIGGQASMTNAIDPSTKRIESTVDRALIRHICQELGQRFITNEEKILARDVLRKELGF